MRRAGILGLGLVLWASVTTGAAAQPRFEGSISPLDRQTRRSMIGVSWHEGCPVALRELRLVRVMYVGFDGRAHHGRLIVHRRWAEELLDVSRRLYRHGFPIRRVRLVDRYDADDQASMRADNTSAFNCRFVAGTSTWSRHAFGAAIDINPVGTPTSGDPTSPRGTDGPMPIAPTCDPA